MAGGQGTTQGQHGIELLLAQVLQGYMGDWQNNKSACFNTESWQHRSDQVTSAGSCLEKNFP